MSRQAEIARIAPAWRQRRYPAPGTTCFSRRRSSFPDLTPAQMARLQQIGRERGFADGELLFEVGYEAVPFFVVLEGAIEVFHHSMLGLHIVATSMPPGRVPLR